MTLAQAYEILAALDKHNDLKGAKTMPATAQQKALAKIQKRAITALSQRLRGASIRQRAVIKEAASALTEQQMGTVLACAFQKAGWYGRTIS